MNDALGIRKLIVTIMVLSLEEKEFTSLINFTDDKALFVYFTDDKA